MADAMTGPDESERLFREARELSSFKFEEGDLPILATTRSGELVKVPERMLGKAANRGITPLGEAERSERGALLRAQEEQAGVLPAIVAGTEEALSTATFGLTDAAMQGLASLAGVSRDEYLRRRAERQEGSPVASGIGTAVGLVAPALLSGGATAAAEGALGAAAKVAGRVGVGGVMEAGRVATRLVERGLERALPASVATAEELSAAFQAARVAGTAAPGARAVAATALRTGFERGLGGAVEGALWGAGEGVRETILGKSDDVAEAIAAGVKTDALLFAGLGGGLGILEAGLPAALSGARKVANRVYDKLPAFGRDALRSRWAAEPGRTGVLAETAEELLAQRDRLVALDARFGDVLDSLATKSPEAVRAAASHVEAVETLAASRKGALEAVFSAPAEVRDAILENATAAVSMEARAKGALDQLLTATPDRLQAAFGKAAAFEALVAGDRKAVGKMLELKSDVLDAALDNVEAIAALEEVTGQKAISAIARMKPDAGRWYVQNAGKIAELEAALPGYWQSFRGMTTGAESEFAVAQADDVLNNWRLSLTNPNERSKVLSEAIEQKSAEFDAGETLSRQLYQVSRAAEEEAFLKVGEIGGPPSLERVQTALFDVAAEAESIAARVADPVAYNPKLAKELDEVATLLRRDFVGLSEAEMQQGLKAKTEVYMNDPGAAFERLREQRTRLGDRIRKLEARRLSLSTAEVDTLDAMVELRDAMTRRYHDPAIFGEAAEARALADDAFRRWKQATEKNGLFDKKFRETIVEGGAQRRIIARTKVNTWLNQIGDARESASVLSELGDNASAWNEVSDAFVNLIDTTQKLMPRIGKATVDVTPEALQGLAQKTIEATKELEQRGFYTRVMNQMRLHVEGGGLNLAGLPVGLGTMGGFPHGVPTAGTSGVTVLPGLGGGVAPEIAAAASAASSIASTVPGGGIAAKGVASLFSIPTQQRQVVARVRGMVAIEEMGKKLADGIEDGARWLIGQATGKKIVAGEAFRALTRPETVSEKKVEAAREDARRARAARAPAAPPVPSLEARPSEEEQRASADLDGIILEANRLASDPSALAARLEEQTSAVAADLPETTAAVGRLAARAARVIARAAPIPDGQPLDSWRPSAADRAAVSRVRDAISRPLELFGRALDGTLTKAEVDAVAEVTPGVLAKMRAAAQAHVEAARVDGRVLSEQNRRGVETLLGYPLTTGSSRPSVARSQAVFGAARAGRTERPTDGMVRPLPGAAKVTLGDRFMTPQQAAASR